MNKRKEAIRGIKFALFSVSAGIIEIVSFALLEAFTPWPYWPKYLIALVLSVLWNFTLNRRFTFRASGNVPIAMLKVACFYVVFTPLSTIVPSEYSSLKEMVLVPGSNLSPASLSSVNVPIHAVISSIYSPGTSIPPV